MSFQPGDVVNLKGSTHKMCVKQVQSNNKIGVIYFDSLLKLCEAQFADVVLQYSDGRDQPVNQFAVPEAMRKEPDTRSGMAQTLSNQANLTPKGKQS